MTDPMNLERLKALEAKATKGPWTHAAVDSDRYGLDHLVVFPNGEDASVLTPADADFIVAARQALPALIARVEALEKVAAAARKHDCIKRIYKLPNTISCVVCTAIDALAAYDGLVSHE